jgi:hypothetical protein
VRILSFVARDVGWNKGHSVGFESGSEGMRISLPHKINTCAFGGRIGAGVLRDVEPSGSRAFNGAAMVNKYCSFRGGARVTPLGLLLCVFSRYVIDTGRLWTWCWWVLCSRDETCCS